MLRRELVAIISALLLSLSVHTYGQSDTDKAASRSETPYKARIRSAQEVQIRSVTGLASQVASLTDKAKRSASMKAQSHTTKDLFTRHRPNDTIYFYQAWIRLGADIDHDGYAHELVIEFDADTIYAYADIYAAIELIDSEGYVTPLVTTDAFTIYQDDSHDTYAVHTWLDSGIISEHYEIAIQLYETHSLHPVAIWSGTQDPDFNWVPLESAEYDVTGGVNFFENSITVDIDRDNDGYGSEFTWSFDANSLDGDTYAYAQLSLSHDGLEWLPLLDSGNFWILGTSALDAIHLPFALTDNIETGHYFLRAELFAVDTGERLALDAISSNATGYTTRYSLESHEWDATPFQSVTVITTEGHVHTGGAVTYLYVLITMLLWIGRQLAKENAE